MDSGTTFAYSYLLHAWNEVWEKFFCKADLGYLILNEFSKLSIGRFLRVLGLLNSTLKHGKCSLKLSDIQNKTSKIEIQKRACYHRFAVWLKPLYICLWKDYLICTCFVPKLWFSLFFMIFKLHALWLGKCNTSRIWLAKFGRHRNIISVMIVSASVYRDK